MKKRHISRKSHLNGIRQNDIIIEWEYLRKKRDRELSKTDFWALKDMTMNQSKKDYRQFLRDLPQNFFDESDETSQGANAAADAWNEYDMPE